LAKSGATVQLPIPYPKKNLIISLTTVEIPEIEKKNIFTLFVDAFSQKNLLNKKHKEDSDLLLKIVYNIR
jgi:hypothetical protein